MHFLYRVTFNDWKMIFQVGNSQVSTEIVQNDNFAQDTIEPFVSGDWKHIKLL